MDSHASRVSEGVINLAKASEVFILTFPSRTTHLLQPLDEGLKSPGQKPNRSDFHRLMKPAFYFALSPETIVSSFRKTGIYTFNPSAVTDDAISTSKLTEKSSVPSIDGHTDRPRPKSPNKELLKVPVFESISKRGNCRKRDGRTKCLTPLQRYQSTKSR
ncbi:hypothetical protein PR048_028062 [Dryococelus australis]|uniref:DDE-1 domain-containing protein n=1 Tax=Dryococelus australis TaxID=614101 RepID=A0ABQ9GI75_9NEOP|nr:hypothetical protein PR048_028062 [Dryococelus australis]